MKIRLFIGIFAALTAAQLSSRAAAVELIPLTNAVWRFNQSSNLDGINWTAPAYDDSSWASGPSLLAFEDNAAITPLRFTTLNDPRTAVAGIQGHAYYFRTHFNWPYPTNNVTLRFTCRLDDCAVFYLNGVLLTNDGVNTPITFSSYGRAAVNGSEATADEVFSIAPSSLLSGDNVLAVEVHQTSAGSSDIVWGAKVEADVDTTPPWLANILPAPGGTVSSLSTVELYFSKPVQGVDAADLLINSQAATSLLTVDAGHYIFGFTQPATGLVQFAVASSHGIADLAGHPFAGSNWICTLDANFVPNTSAFFDQWRADALSVLNDGDAVGSWTSVSNRTVTGGAPMPIFKNDATPAGGPVVRFNQNLLAGSSPLSDASAFSIAIVFKAAAVGAGGDGSSWYQCTGLVDAQQTGAATDWGTVFNGAGHVGIGTGQPDITTFSTGPSLTDGNFHAAVFTWGGGLQSVYVDRQAPVFRTGVSTLARGTFNFAFGGIQTGEGGTAQRFVGDVAEIRLYNTYLGTAEAGSVITELTDLHITGKLPIIRSFTASPNPILIGAPATLSWNVKTNADLIFIDRGVGLVTGFSNSIPVFPRTNTTYTLTTSNVFGLRTAQVTVLVDQGIPVASNQTVGAVMNIPQAIMLRGADPQGSNLTFTITSGPFHGSLQGALPNVIYTPATNYFGNDQFTFVVSDGEFVSPPATIAIQVIPPPLPPTAIVLTTTNINAGAGPGSFIAALRAIDPNPADTHTFVLVPGFGDNARFVLQGNQLQAGPTFAGDVGSTFTIRLSATDNTSLSVTQDFVLRVIDLGQSIVINEVNYNPPDNTRHEEFIELHNPTPGPVDVSLWRITGGINLLIPAGTVISSGGFLVLAQDPLALVSRYGAASLGPWEGALDSEGDRITLSDANGQKITEMNYASEFPWPIGANGNGGSMALVNPSLDNDLGSSWRTENPPTPGITNRVFATNAPPNIRQVHHEPNTPASTNQVVITAKVTDPNGVASVQLQYQVVSPGNYISAITPLTTAQLNPLTDPALEPAANPAFENAANWTTVPMVDNGTGRDAVAGDSIYTATLPSQANRTLVRYRVVVTDAMGATRRAPFEDDPSLNFAYFVYDGIPAYEGHSSAVMQTLPVYSLLTRSLDFDTCTAYTGNQLGQANGSVANEGRFVFDWEGAFVYEGEVYDHIRYRLEGANGRYQNGRRNFAFRFNDGRHFAAKDQDGQPYPKKWSRLNICKGQSNRQTVTFSLNEAMTYFLCNKVGVPSPLTHYMHWRVIRGAQEQPDTYGGDFYGVFMIQENYDARFLDTHSMEKGTLYKLINMPRALPSGGNADMLGQQRYQAPYAPTNAQDAVNAEAVLLGPNPRHDTASLLAYVNYPKWYRYHAIIEAVRDYDFWPDANKNCAWYFEPAYGASNSFGGRMWTLPWDATDTWGPTWNAGQDICYAGIFQGTPNTELQIQYFNSLREVRDLLIQPDQVNPMIDALAAKLTAIMPANLVRWSNSPPAGSSYQSMAMPGPALSGGLPAYVQDMKNFLFAGGTYSWWVGGETVGAGGWAASRLDSRSADAANIPVRPTITYAGSNNFVVTDLIFRSSAFSDPQGAGTFAAMQWRVAEITPTNTPVSSAAELKWEWDAVWESGVLTTFTNQIKVPAVAVLPGKTYRARVRHMDTTGRWSNWSAPVQFVPAPSGDLHDLIAGIALTEIMYNPPTVGTNDGDSFEFLELKNVGATVLDLSGLAFTSGITFTFSNGTTLAPGQFFVLGRNLAALQSKYPALVVRGIYSGKIKNSGDTVTLTHPYGTNIFSVTYGDRLPWPVVADGYGFSLVRDAASSTGYRASALAGGSPGADDSMPSIPHVLIDEIMTHPLLLDRDAIELFNDGPTNADLSGWFLTDDAGYPWKYRIADGTLLPAGCYLVVDESQFNPTPGVGVSFGLNMKGDDVYLFSADAAGNLTGYTHGFSFGAAEQGVTFGRYINSVGEEQFPAQLLPTLSTNNAAPRVGLVVISEIMYHPPPTGDQFVELQNNTATNILLYDAAVPTNTWKLAGLGFALPTDGQIPAGGRALIVGMDPTAFRAKYAVPGGVPIFGPFTGTLQQSGELLELQWPRPPYTNGVDYVTMDAVRYNDKVPWPTVADGSGPALQRIALTAYGNDPINWRAAAPTPGVALVGGTVPVITIQPASANGEVGLSAMFNVTASGSEPIRYQWLFAGSAIAGATNSVLTLDGLQFTQNGAYSVVVFNGAGSVVSSNASLTVTTASGRDQVVINEIMYNPAAPNAGYVEIFNRSTTTAFDLSNWRCNELTYTFPAGTMIQPQNFLVLTKDRAAFVAAHGTNVAVFDVFSGSLPTNGGTLTLLKPGTPDLVICKVRYENVLPWPVDLLGRPTTASVQLIDAAQDITRPCNWATFGGGSRTNTDWSFVSVTATNSGAQSRLWIFLDTPGDAYLDDLSLVTGSVPGVGTNYIRNAGFETNLGGSFIVSTNYSVSVRVSDAPHSGSNCLHVVCHYAPAVANNKTNTVIYQNLSPAAPANQLCTLSFWYRSGAAPCGLTVKMQFPSVSTNASVVPAFVSSTYTNTPGAANYGATNLPAIPPLWINEVVPQNLTGLTNRAGQRGPWLELFNAGSNVVSLQGLYLADNYTNLTQWTFPAGAAINPGEFKTVFADGNTGLSTLTELHTSFQLAATNGSIALARVRSGVPEVLDYLNYSGVPADRSFGSVPDGQPFDRQLMYYPTPGQTNNPATVPAMLHASANGNVVTLTFNTTAGQNYRVEYKEQLSSGLWNVLVPAQAATGPSMSVNDTLNAAPQRFYRVVTP